MGNNKIDLTIAVTGADGFIGKKLCHVLEKDGYKVVRYDSDNFDIRNKVKISDEIDVIYHLASINKPYFSKLKPGETFRTNVLGTLNLLEAVEDSNVKKIIFTSSIFVYKDLNKTKETDLVEYNGIYPYGLEKIIGEKYIKIYSDLCGIDYTIFRISGVYGPEMFKNPIFDVIQGFLNNKIKLYVNKNSVYNFIYIDDVVDALVKSLDWEKGVFNLCSDENIKIIDIYDFLSRKLGKKIDIEDTNLLMSFKGNNEKIKKKAWKINHPLKEGLLETYNYFIKNEL